jgi:hypothetical protein
VYVDDIVSITNNSDLRKRILEDMTKSFKLTDSGLAKWLLGTLIVQENGKVKMDQSKYVGILLRRFGIDDCKPVATPMVAISGEQTKIEENERNLTSNLANRAEYMSAVGGLIYLSVVSRPDISYAVSKAGQQMANPSVGDMVRVKRIFRYLKGTANYC